MLTIILVFILWFTFTPVMILLHHLMMALWVALKLGRWHTGLIVKFIMNAPQPSTREEFLRLALLGPLNFFFYLKGFHEYRKEHE